MTARIAGFETRAAIGLRAPDSVSRNITPANGGAGVHYGGPRQSAADPGADHGRCIATWRGWQAYHMNVKGWADIAYTGGFCNHGFAFAGRGAGVRTAANGTNYGNQNFYAVTWIGGEGQHPTQEALDAADWWIETLRKTGAGRAVWPHRRFKPTGCPGDPLVGYADSRHNVDIGSNPAPPAPENPTPAPTPEGDEMDRLPVLRRGATGQGVRNLQGLLVAAGRRVTVDGDFGPGTDQALRDWQGAAGLAADGICGPMSWGRFLGLR